MDAVVIAITTAKLNIFFITHSSHSLRILPNTENVNVKLDVLTATLKHCLHMNELNR